MLTDDRPIEKSARYQRRPHSAILSAAASSRRSATESSPSPKKTSPEHRKTSTRKQHSPPHQRQILRTAASDSLPQSGSESHPSSSSEHQHEIYRAQRRQRDGGIGYKGLLFDDQITAAAMPRNASPILGGNERGDSREGRRRLVTEIAKEKAQDRFQRRLDSGVETHEVKQDEGARKSQGKRVNVITGMIIM